MSRQWQPARHWLFLWRLEQIAYQDWAGTGIRYRKDRMGFVVVFWTRAQAQAYADRLNGRVQVGL